MGKENLKTGINAKEYMRLRKVLSDRDYYRDGNNSTSITDLMIMLNGSASGLDFGDEKGHSKNVTQGLLLLYDKNRELAFQDLVSYSQDGSLLSKSTIDTLKVYSDFCFYAENPDLFGDLCYSVYNDRAPIKFKSFDMPAIDAYPRTYETAYRMLFYDKNQIVGKHGERVTMFHPDISNNIEEYYTNFQDGKPSSFEDAYAVFEHYKSLFILQQCGIGRRFITHSETDSKRLNYYISSDFDASKVSQDKMNGVDVGKQSSAPDLAREMSGYMYRNEPNSQLAQKNKVKRVLFDEIAQSGELPNAIFLGDSQRCSLRECLKTLGPEEFLNTADAAFYMNCHAEDYKRFLLLQKIYDMHADTIYKNNHKDGVQNEEVEQQNENDAALTIE